MGDIDMYKYPIKYIFSISLSLCFDCLYVYGLCEHMHLSYFLYNEI